MSIGGFLGGLFSGPRPAPRTAAPPPRQGVGFGWGAGSWGAGGMDFSGPRRQLEAIPAQPRQQPQREVVDLSGLNNPDMGFVEPGHDSGRLALGRRIEPQPVMSSRAPPQGEIMEAPTAPRPAPVEVPDSSPRPAESAAPRGGSAGIVNSLGDLDSAPTTGLPYMLPTEDPDLGDPRRAQFVTAAPRVDDPLVSTVPVSGDIDGVAPDLLAAHANAIEQAYGPGARTWVTSGRRTGPAGASDHNSGEAIDWGAAGRDGVVSDASDPRVYDAMRVAVARGPVQAVGIGPDYMGGRAFHSGTGRGQGRDYIRTWSDWNTGDELARVGRRGSADPGGAGDPNWNFGGELERIQEGRQIALERNVGTPVAAAPDRSIRPQTRPDAAAPASARTPQTAAAGGIDWVEVEGPDGSPMWVSRDFLRDEDGNYVRGSIEAAAPYLEQYGARLPQSVEEIAAINASAEMMPFLASGGGPTGAEGGFAGQYPNTDNYDELVALHNEALAAQDFPTAGIIAGHLKDLLGDGSLYHPDQGLQGAHRSDPTYRDYSQGIRLVRTDPPEGMDSGGGRAMASAAPSRSIRPPGRPDLETTASTRRPPASAVSPPEEYADMAFSAAERFGVDPALFNAVVHQESRWDPTARSPVGAYGLTQAMPNTARNPGFGVQPLTDIDNPAEQLRFGAEYLSAMLNRYDGDVTRALVAYNWGPGNADRWDGNMASLPEETRNYVRIITGNAGSRQTFNREERAPARGSGRTIRSGRGSDKDPIRDERGRRVPFWVAKFGGQA